ncbi:Hypothetical predicted protein, partial [Marmota monax]
PRTLVDALSEKTTISFSECIIQVFTFHFFSCLEIFILIFMAVDRYVAICKPLHYMTIMSRRVCSVLVALAWVGSCVHSLAQIFLALRLPYCGPNEIHHYFCDLEPLLKLACTDIYVTNLLLVSNSGAICTVSFVMLMFSYVIILHSYEEIVFSISLFQLKYLGEVVQRVDNNIYSQIICLYKCA